MRTTIIAKTELEPLLERLIKQLDQEGRLTHKAHFKRIHWRLTHAHTDLDLAAPIIDLSSARAIGFEFSSTAHALIARILDKTRFLVDELAEQERQVH